MELLILFRWCAQYHILGLTLSTVDSRSSCFLELSEDMMFSVQCADTFREALKKV